jgi:hypothetical protein
MRSIMHKWQGHTSDTAGLVKDRPPTVPGTLPSFARPLGLDFIITDEGQVILIELQHGFGRRGLLELFPQAHRRYRQIYWQLRRELGQNTILLDGLRRYCGNKIQTYKLLADYQPSSFIYRGPTPELEHWLTTRQSDFVLAKPPRGSCGKGILVFRRLDLLDPVQTRTLTVPMLLQEFVRSRSHLDDQGRGHVGCIRHIALMSSDGGQLNFLHLPSYWRVSPEYYVHGPDKDALTANISRGAFALPLKEEEGALLRPLAERICLKVVQHILGLPGLTMGQSDRLRQDRRGLSS